MLPLTYSSHLKPHLLAETDHLTLTHLRQLNPIPSKQITLDREDFIFVPIRETLFAVAVIGALTQVPFAAGAIY